jgi:4-oxalocrotonate tautomerase
MPIVQVEILEGRTVEQKRAMVQKVTEVLCETLICPPENVTIVIREMRKEHLAKGGKLAIDN